MPPIGFLGVGAMPTWAGASSRRTALEDSNRFCAVWEARRTINAQAIALFRTYEVSPPPPSITSRGTPQSLFGNHFPARARDYVHVRRATRQPTATATAPFASKMAPKRPSLQDNSGRQTKKRKITAARSISVQRAGGPSRISKSNDSTGQWAAHSPML